MFGYFERKRTAARIAEEQIIAEATRKVEEEKAIVALAEKLLEEKLIQIEEDKKAAIQKKEDDEIEELRLAKIALEERRKKHKDSGEPYFEMISDGLTEKGLRMEFDWNDVWIDYLKKHGFDGVDDEAIVHKYLAALQYEQQRDEIATTYAGLAPDNSGEQHEEELNN